MHHYRTLEGLNLDNAWATIGSFDGVHRGHQSLIKQMVAGAHAGGNQAVVVTFYPHPAVVLRGIQEPYYLTSPDERADLLHDLGVDAILTLKFDRGLASQSAEEFMTNLSQHTGLRQLWVGPDFALGKGRQGTPLVLQEIGKRLGYTVKIVEQVSVGEERVSSSQIRSLISNGKVNEAANMLGRLYGVKGEVIHGDGRGKDLGIPTANLQVWPERLLPANGIYATWVVRGNERLASVTNVGVRPTFDDHTNLPRIEAFILDFNQDIYHEQIEVEFVEYFRPEIRYTSIDDLMEQIHKDIEQAREVLSHATRTPGLPARPPEAKS
jgi:riboflavin kinase / FMN adenylyltransferase